MVSDLPLVDQVWMFALIFTVIVGCLAILVLLGPAFVRDIVGLFRGDADGPGPTDPDVESRVARFADRVEDDRRRVELISARDREIQEIQ